MATQQGILGRRFPGIYGARTHTNVPHGARTYGYLKAPHRSLTHTYHIHTTRRTHTRLTYICQYIHIPTAATEALLPIYQTLTSNKYFILKD